MNFSHIHLGMKLISPLSISAGKEGNVFRDSVGKELTNTYTEVNCVEDVSETSNVCFISSLKIPHSFHVDR